ncbi:peptidoglycan-binding domain-containing protein (plasmid) [Streptomyces sp. BI20]|uniref:peptidoglycan-binding domain-containing protein n=1 Tax=Streptomyces sp. BI20 TaxID=3403460 RepID=UPI003C793AEF
MNLSTGVVVTALGLALMGPVGTGTDGAAAVPGNCAHTATTDRPTLREGARGAAVRQAQCLGNVWGGVPKVEANGVYGPSTTRKIRWIQGCHGLPKDGVVGARTWEALYHPVADCYDPYPK